MPIPFLLYSDGPRQPTGLARIARDLASRLWAERDVLGIDLLQCGYDPLPGPPVPWPTYHVGHMRMDDESDWGAEAVDRAYLSYFGGQAGIVFSIWDPGRAYNLLRLQAPAERWGYFPIDGTNVRGSLSGPARETLERYDRVLSYTRWASEVVATIRRPAPWLPHGLDLDIWTYQQDGARVEWIRNLLRLRDGEILVGSVMANQPRKDWGVAVQTISELWRRGWRVRAWWHTDSLIKPHAWNLAQLIADHGLEKAVVVTGDLTDADLAACYSLCGVTILPTKGEGWGFPIVESLACGTPCVTTDCAGGAELVPVNAWRVPVRTWQVEASFYGLQRPVVAAEDVANAVERALAWKRAEERIVQAYCRAQVEYLSWPTLWPRWRSWVRQGLEAV